MLLSVTPHGAEQQGSEPHRAESEPFYLPVADEVSLFEAAYRERIPVLLWARPAAEKHVLSNTWRGISLKRRAWSVAMH